MELYAGRNHADTVAGFSAFQRRITPTLEDVTRFICNVTKPDHTHIPDSPVAQPETIEACLADTP